MVSVQRRSCQVPRNNLKFQRKFNQRLVQSSRMKFIVGIKRSSRSECPIEGVVVGVFSFCGCPHMIRIARMGEIRPRHGIERRQSRQTKDTPYPLKILKFEWSYFWVSWLKGNWEDKYLKKDGDFKRWGCAEKQRPKFDWSTITFLKMQQTLRNRIFPVLGAH